MRQCAPGAARGEPGACRAGFVCTGWWFTYSNGEADVAGCVAFCSADSDCLAGERCNPRMGLCGGALPDPGRLPDGSPCDPSMTALVPEESTRRNVQCRGQCFQRIGGPATQGICGSLIDLAVTPRCPDDPTLVRPFTDPGADNLGLCIVRSCTTNRDCRSPLLCRYPEDASRRPVRTAPPSCDYATTAQPTGIP